MSDRIKVWLDDTRVPPNSDWIHVATAGATITLLESGLVEYVSLDHDLGMARPSEDEEVCGTGYDVLVWMEEQVHTSMWRVPTILIHTANVAARVRMEAARTAIQKAALDRDWSHYVA